MLSYWIDVEAADGTRYGPGPILTATGWTKTPKLDAAGTFSFSLPVSDPMSTYLLNKRIVRCRGIKDGVVTELGAGIIDKIALDPGDVTMLTVSGPDIMAELAGPSVHGLIIREQAWTHLDDATHGTLHWIEFREGPGWYYDGDHANAHDNNTGTYSTVTIRSRTVTYSQDAVWLYIGYDARFDAIDFDFETPVTPDDHSATQTVELQYYSSTTSGWVTLAHTDNTIDTGNGSWTKDGTITFTRPTDWERYNEAVGGAGNWFWVRIRANQSGHDDPRSLTADIREIQVYADFPTTGGVDLIMAYAPVTWTRTGYPATVSPKYIEYRGQTVLEALVILSEQGGTDGGDAVREHFRLGTGRAIDWMGTTVNASGVRAVSPTDPIAAEGAPELVLIERLQKETDSAEVVTRIYPESGDQQGIGPATDAAPTGYTRGSITQGINTFWYLQHTAGYNAYGLIERWVEFSELRLQQADSYTTHPVDLGNALQERGAEYLRTHALANEFYRLSIVQFPALILPGDTIECVYHEWIVDPVTGAVHTVNIDTIRDGAPLHVLAPTLTIDGSGVSVQALEVATIDRAPKSDAGVVVDLVRQQRNSGAGASNLASMAAGGAGTPPSAGPDIRVSGYQVSRAGAGVLLFDSGGALLREYATIAAALAAMASGDVVQLSAGVFTENVTVPAGGTLRGMGWSSVIDGTITLGDGALLDDLAVMLDVDSAGAAIGILGPDSGTSRISDCWVRVSNATGQALGVEWAGGDMYIAYSYISAIAPLSIALGGAETSDSGDVWISASWLDGGTRAVGHLEATASAEVVASIAGEGKVLDTDSPPAGWYEQTYDDSAWAAPVAQGGAIWGPAITGSEWVTWQSGNVANGPWLYRRTFALLGVASSASLDFWVDDKCDAVYLNDVQIFTGPTGGRALLDVDETLLIVGNNTLSILCRNDYSGLTPTSLSYVFTAMIEGVTETLRVHTSGVRMTPVTGDPVLGDRSAFDVANFPLRHASDLANALPHEHNPWPAAAGYAPVSDGNKYVATDVLTPAEHTAIGDGSPHRPAQAATINVIIDGGGSAITTGIKCDVEIPFACTISQVTMLADQEATAVVDLWVEHYADFPPTDADSIASATPPTITAAVKSQDTTLTTWIVALEAGQILRVNVDSNDVAEIITISLKVTRS